MSLRHPEGLSLNCALCLCLKSAVPHRRHCCCTQQYLPAIAVHCNPLEDAAYLNLPPHPSVQCPSSNCFHHDDAD